MKIIGYASLNTSTFSHALSIVDIFLNPRFYNTPQSLLFYMHDGIIMVKEKAHQGNFLFSSTSLHSFFYTWKKARTQMYIFQGNILAVLTQSDT